MERLGKRQEEVLRKIANGWRLYHVYGKFTEFQLPDAMAEQWAIWCNADEYLHSPYGNDVKLRDRVCMLIDKGFLGLWRPVCEDLITLISELEAQEACGTLPLHPDSARGQYNRPRRLLEEFNRMRRTQYVLTSKAWAWLAAKNQLPLVVRRTKNCFKR